MSTQELAAALAGVGIIADVDGGGDGRVAVLRTGGASDLRALADPRRRRDVVALARTAGFASVAVELTIDPEALETPGAALPRD